jgi:CubicO group peptidase (beta-lactamase class C family)
MGGMKGITAVLCAVAGVGIALPPPASAQTLGDRIDAYFASYAANADLSGVVLVGTPDSVLFARAYGEADVEQGVPNRLDTRFRVASLTKTFTAAAIISLRDEGELELTDYVGEYIPEFPHGDRITIRHLLRHESGLSNPDYLKGFDRRVTLEELVADIGSRPLLFEPGTDGRYSNAGFNVLALVIQRVTGMAYADYLKRRFFDPLEMSATGHVGSDLTTSGWARPYRAGPGPRGLVHVPGVDPSYSIGSGSLWSTAEDLLEWARAVGSNRFIDLDSVEYPYGWGRLGEEGDEGIDQTGLSIGFASSLSIQFDPAVYVVVLSNVDYSKWFTWGHDVLAMVAGEDRPGVPRRRLVPLDASTLSRYTGDYASDEGQVVHVEAHDGNLWIRRDEWPVPDFLSPVAADSFETRSRCGPFRFGRLEDRYRTLESLCEFGQVIYERTDPTCSTGVATDADLQRLADELIDRAGLPGLSLAVLRDGHLGSVVVSGARGPDARVTPCTVFEAASLSKPVFTYGVLRLVDDGRLDLDRPLVAYLPDQELPYGPGHERITARMILTHTSALPNQLPSEGEKLALLGPPGEQFRYSGDAFLLLQRAVEEVTGEPLGSWIEKSVLSPLGMHRSTFVWEARFAEDMAAGLDPTMSASACCSLITTAADYSRFLEASLNGRALHEVTRREMLEPQVSVAPDISWGLGWALEEGDQGRSFWHWGHSHGPFRSFALVEESSGEGVVFFANSEDGLSIVKRVLAATVGGWHPLVEWMGYPQLD